MKDIWRHQKTLLLYGGLHPVLNLRDFTSQVLFFLHQIFAWRCVELWDLCLEAGGSPPTVPGGVHWTELSGAHGLAYWFLGFWDLKFSFWSEHVSFFSSQLWAWSRCMVWLDDEHWGGIVVRFAKLCSTLCDPWTLQHARLLCPAVSHTLIGSIT